MLVVQILRGLGLLVGLTLTGFLIVTCPLWWGRPMGRAVIVPARVALDAGAVALEPLGDAVSSVGLGRISAELVLVMANPWWYWLFMLLILVLAALIVWVLTLLLAVVRDVLRGEPFTVANALRVRRIGMVSVGIAVFETLATLALSSWGTSLVAARGATLAVDVTEDGTGFLLGWLIVVLGEAFRRGAAMAEEQALTV
jgi:hypothetical protein